MKLKVLTAAIAVVFGLVVAAALAMVMLLALNGAAEADANGSLLLYAVGSLITTGLAGFGAFRMSGRLAARGRRPFVAAAVTLVPLLFLVATAQVVLAFSGIIMYENARKARVLRSQ